MRNQLTFALLGIAVLATVVLLQLSHIHASHRADALIAKVRTPGTFARTYSGLSWIRSFCGHLGPVWEFSYDPNDFGTSDVTLEVNLWGTVIDSNPPTALAKLQALP